jgi:hypothetical protein
VTNVTGGGVDPKIFTTADFTTEDTVFWSCTANVGNANDSCTASAGVPAGFTIYIRIDKTGAGSSTFTLNVQ